MEKTRAKKKTAKRKTAKRELIAPKGDKRYVTSFEFLYQLL